MSKDIIPYGSPVGKPVRDFGLPSEQVILIPSGDEEAGDEEEKEQVDPGGVEGFSERFLRMFPPKESSRLRDLDEQVEVLSQGTKALRWARMASISPGLRGLGGYVESVGSSRDPFGGVYGHFVQDFAQTSDEEEKGRIFGKMVRSMMAHGYPREHAQKRAVELLVRAGLIVLE